MMMKMLPGAVDVIAPDGSEVRLLAAAARGSMAHFTLAPGHVSRAVYHRSVEEIWFVIAGVGHMWMMADGQEQVIDLMPRLSFSIPVGTVFQFRCDGDQPLQAVAITMPPWPGEGEAVAAPGKWQPIL